VNRQPEEWEKTFAHYTSDLVLVIRIYKEFKNLSIKTSPIKKWAVDLNRHFSKENK
jgi:hypothetical protein